MTMISGDIPKTVTPGKAKNLLAKAHAQYLSSFEDFKGDMSIEAEIIQELGADKSEWLDTINYYSKEIKCFTRDYIKLVKTIKAAAQRHADKKGK